MYRCSTDTLEQFKKVLQQLPSNLYAQPCVILSGSSIGQHTRHIIELYLCLINGYNRNLVCYDKRNRDKKIEQDVDFACEKLTFIQNNLQKENKDIVVEYELNGIDNRLNSNYDREVMYNLEHTIHHQALIKVGILHFTDIELPEDFGVAPSTMQYKAECVQ